MTPVSSQSRPHQTQAVWPWIVMPAVVLVVFCILHYDVRPMGSAKVTGPPATAPSSGSTNMPTGTSIPTE